MTDAEFRSLVERLEPLAAERPGRYRARVGALALLGYAYIGAVLALLVLLVALAVFLAVRASAVAGIKLLVVLLIVIVAILRALWVRIPAPEGVRLRSADAPRLFEEIGEVRAEVGAPKVHVVAVNADFNAAIVQVPRLGMFGWYRNYLLVGLPLLQAVTPDEWRGILAHEMGHLSGSHGRFASWIYRQRRTWSRLLATLEEQQSRLGMLLFGRFFQRFSPFFNAYSFVLARAHEYEADRAAAGVVGAGTMRDALVRIEASGRHLGERFWAGVERSTAETREPPRDVYQRLRAALRAGPDPEDETAWVSEALRRPTELHDTHPGLGERLRALGWEPGPGGELPDLPERLDGPAAAEACLGELEAPIELSFEQHWVASVQHQWRRRFDELDAARSRLEELDGRPVPELSEEERWERVRIAADLGEDERAERLARRLLDDAPEHAGALLFLGHRLLRRDGKEGIELVERAMDQSPDAILPGCQLLFDHHWSRGEKEAAERYRDRGNARAGELGEAERERTSIGRSVELTPHDLPDDVVRHLGAQLAEAPGVRRAWLARRVVRLCPEIPCYVVGVEPRRGWSLLSSEKSLRKRFAETVLSLDAPPGAYFFLLIGETSFLRRRLRKIAGSELDLTAGVGAPGAEAPAPLEPAAAG